MSISIVQVTGQAPGGATNSLNVGISGVGNNHSLVVAVSLPSGNQVIGIVDNAAGGSNSYRAVSGAAISDSSTGHGSDVWWAPNVIGGNLVVTITINGTANNSWSVDIFEVIGIGNAATLAGTSVVIDTTDVPFAGPSLNGGGSALFLSNLAGFAGDSCSVATPWSNSGTANSNGGQSVASLVGGGTAFPTFSPNPAVGDFIGVISGVAFTTSTYTVSGNAGVAGATVAYSGLSSGSTTADGSGNFSVPALPSGSYTFTPSLGGYTFSPASSPVTISGANVTGVNFAATALPYYSVPDCRNFGNFPNHSANVQGTLTYTVPSVDSRAAGAPVDSRAAGAPVDSRVASNIPTNSRNNPPF
jgi:hypothetical protein